MSAGTTIHFLPASDTRNYLAPPLISDTERDIFPKTCILVTSDSRSLLPDKRQYSSRNDYRSIIYDAGFGIKFKTERVSNRKTVKT